MNWSQRAQDSLPVRPFAQSVGGQRACGGAGLMPALGALSCLTALQTGPVIKESATVWRRDHRAVKGAQLSNEMTRFLPLWAKCHDCASHRLTVNLPAWEGCKS